MNLVWTIIVILVVISLFGYTPYNRNYYGANTSHGLLMLAVILIALRLCGLI